MSFASKDFYASLVPFKKFSDLTDAAHYKPVPEDWWVIITDVKGSTEALENNRYKDVNLLGASSIIAILNKLKGREVPFIFGGDGATLLVHESEIEQVKPALRGTQRMARDVLGFDLRVGLVPVGLLVGSGTSIHVAKFAISEKSNIAMMRGGGLTYVEKLVKDAGDAGAAFRMRLNETVQDEETSFEGLSCRWNPIKAKRGEMMSLLILATRQDNSEVVYKRVIQKIDSILDEKQSRPIGTTGAGTTTNLRSLLKEMQMHTLGKSFGVKFRRLLSILVEVLFMRGSMLTGLKTEKFGAEKYLREMGENTDFQKFDDMIRMVRDCTSTQRDQILAMLKNERALGTIAYGVHMSSEALLTCLVFRLDDHIHFVDGSGGGYALAAKQLKEQLKEKPLNTSVDASTSTEQT